MNTTLLDELYKKYDIANLSYGKVHDKLGDVYEEFCVRILSDEGFLVAAKQGRQINCVEFELFKALLSKAGYVDFSSIKEIMATNKVPHRSTKGNAKTDIIATIIDNKGMKTILPISSKQSYAAKVAIAEFDVDTICQEAVISNERIKILMQKFQVAKSAKGLTDGEQEELKELLVPYAKNLVRWAIAGSPEENPMDVVFPKFLVKFKVVKPKDRYNIHVDKGELQYVSFSIFTIDEYVNSLIYDKKGRIKKGGFGTGLSWTYASGSGGHKIQFKG